MAVVRLLEAVLLAFDQHLRGRHPSDQHLAGLTQSAALARSVLSITCNLASKGKAPRKPLPPHSAVGQLAGQLGGLPAAPPPDQTQAAPTAELGLASH